MPQPRHACRARVLAACVPRVPEAQGCLPRCGAHALFLPHEPRFCPFTW